MLQGTGSDVGKSLLAAGLCRAYHRRGLRVQPFKPQNMSNNAAVTIEGGEIGRAQALQARAAGQPLSVHMNPVLLKPQSETGAQVVVQGRVEGTAQALDYHDLKPKLLPRVLESFAILAADADLVVVEGAGSPAEVNLRPGDIANMGFAEAADLPVVLIADVERGGALAAIIGTLALLSPEERARIRGYVINKFRGDTSLFVDAIEIIKSRTNLECFGIVPFFEAARRLPKEDAMSLDTAKDDSGKGADIKIAVPRLSRIANFDDLDPLAADPGVGVEIIEPGTPIPGDAHVVVIPGSKSTLADLAVIRDQGWDVDIAAHRRRGGRVVGLCGGYQILGQRIADPDGVEGESIVSGQRTEGLGLLDVETVITGEKALKERSGAEIASGEPVRGYEMHIGETSGPGLDRPWLRLDDGHGEGAVSADGLVMGTYLHGIFAADMFRHAFLGRLGLGEFEGVAYEAMIEETLDALAAHLENHLDLDALLAAAGRVKASDLSATG
jgi:adenosylcobyric acid synthase